MTTLLDALLGIALFMYLACVAVVVWIAAGVQWGDDE